MFLQSIPKSKLAITKFLFIENYKRYCLRIRKNLKGYIHIVRMDYKIVGSYRSICNQTSKQNKPVFSQVFRKIYRSKLNKLFMEWSFSTNGPKEKT